MDAPSWKGKRMAFYSWNDTLGYEADMTCVISDRGFGKTFGLREQCIRDYKRDGSRFVEVVRVKEEIADVMDGYLDKVAKDSKVLKGYIWKNERGKILIAKKPQGDERPSWDVLAYFVALTQMQRSKKKTYVKVKRIIFDEAILDYTDQYHRYLPNEYNLLVNVVDSCTRQAADVENNDPAHVYLLGNACDLINPYFQAYGITEVPPHGKSWYAGKTFLLDYVDPGERAQRKIDNTLAGRLSRVTGEARMIAYNEFANANTDWVATKPRRAKFQYGMVYRSMRFGVWSDMAEGLIYINRKIPKGDIPIYSMTTRDNRVNMLMAKRADKPLRALLDLYYMGCVRYDSAATRERFLKVLSLFGIR